MASIAERLKEAKAKQAELRRKLREAEVGGVKSDNYDDHREAMAEKSRSKSKDGREIGTIPDIANIDRRESCRHSLKLFCKTYNPNIFYFGWSSAHLAAIARIEEAVTMQALFAFAMARGSGKTTISRMASLWATAYAHCRYVYIIGATADKAEASVDALKSFIRFLPAFQEDFPEISYPATRLNGIANRATGQTCGGESTMIQWGKTEVLYPSVPPPNNWPKEWRLRSDGKVPTSGTMVTGAGLTSEGIRGSLATSTMGEQIRPDLVLLDDPQTPESAFSFTQNEKRLRLISSDVLGMAAPGQSLAGIMPCTVIARGDMIDQVLDRKKHPLWRGERTKLLAMFPKNLDAWEDYWDVYQTCAQLEPPNYEESNAYYLEHRERLDEGAEATWEDRYNKETEVGAIQGAMHLYFRDRIGFMAEYQNEPLDITMLPGTRRLVVDELAERTNGVDRGIAPRECSRITMFIDPGAYLHWYIVVAWSPTFAGHILDYGTWPPQNSTSFTKDSAARKLESYYPRLSQAEYVHEGLKDLCAKVLNREYKQDVTGADMRCDHAMIDSGFQSTVVHQFARQLQTFGTTVIVSKGVPRTTGRSPIAKWADKPGDLKGWNWRRTLSETKRGHMIQFDTDAFKSFVYDRWTEHAAGRSAMHIYGDKATGHKLILGHMTAECGIVGDPEKNQGAEFEKWRVVPNTDLDNDWFDCLVGATVSAMVSGLTWTATGAVEKAAKRKISIEELYKRANS